MEARSQQMAVTESPKFSSFFINYHTHRERERERERETERETERERERTGWLVGPSLHSQQ